MSVVFVVGFLLHFVSVQEYAWMCKPWFRLPKCCRFWCRHHFKTCPWHAHRHSMCNGCWDGWELGLVRSLGFGAFPGNDFRCAHMSFKQYIAFTRCLTLAIVQQILQHCLIVYEGDLCSLHTCLLTCCWIYCHKTWTSSLPGISESTVAPTLVEVLIHCTYSVWLWRWVGKIIKWLGAQMWVDALPTECKASVQSHLVCWPQVHVHDWSFLRTFLGISPGCNSSSRVSVAYLWWYFPHGVNFWIGGCGSVWCAIPWGSWMRGEHLFIRF